MMTAANYRKDLINLTRELSSSKVRELWDFARFLKTKPSVHGYKGVSHSAEYEPIHLFVALFFQ